MIRARTFDPVNELVINVDVADIDGVARLIEQAVARRSGRGCPAVELSRDDDSSLSIDTDGVRAVLVWINSLDESTHSVGEGVGDVLVYDYFGSWSEAPPGWTVSLADALSGARRFLETGTPQYESLPFELDQG